MNHIQTTTCRVEHQYEMTAGELELMVREHFHIPSDARFEWGLVFPGHTGFLLQFTWSHERVFPTETPNA